MEQSTLKPGVRYDVQIPGEIPVGYFLNNRYYESGHESGHLEGDVFLYYMVDGSGQPKFPDGVAGHLKGLEIIMDGNPTYKLVEKTNK